MFFQFEQWIPRLTTLTSSATELTILAQVLTNRRIEVIYNVSTPEFLTMAQNSISPYKDE